MIRRKNIKITDCDPSLVLPSMFENKKSYEYFMIGFYAMKELQELKDKSYIILDRGIPIEDYKNFYISFDVEKKKLTMPRIGLFYNYGLTMWLGATMGNIPNTIFVYKKELNDAFGKIKYFLPKDETKLVLKTLTEYQNKV